jgi:hypothetical protein
VKACEIEGNVGVGVGRGSCRDVDGAASDDDDDMGYADCSIEADGVGSADEPSWT